MLDALLVKAEKGDVPAGCEYRAWHDQMLGRPEGTSVSEGDIDTPYEDMTPGERAVVRARVVREIARLEAEADE